MSEENNSVNINDEVDFFYPIDLLMTLVTPNNLYMFDVMTQLFDELIDESYYELREEKMMEIAIQESLENYKTQEKKPNIELDIKSSVSTNSLKGDNCVICNSEFEINENITNLVCKHVLHTKCISEWVKYKPECPICRASIKVIDTEKKFSSVLDTD
jgi:hypothetical protein